MDKGMLDGRAVIGVLAEQSGVASVQSCDDARSRRSYDLRGETRGQRVWYRVMNMKKIELPGTRHFRHFHCERQSVVGTGKQSIIRKIDSMKMKAFLRQV